MEEIVYEPVAARFRVMFRGPVKFGAFFLTRCLYHLDARGKAWQENAFVVAVGVLTVAAVSLDIVAIYCAWMARLAFYVLRGLWRLTLYAAKVVLDKLVGTAFKWAAVAAIILILYFKWDEISAALRLWRW